MKEALRGPLQVGTATLGRVNSLPAARCPFSMAAGSGVTGEGVLVCLFHPKHVVAIACLGLDQGGRRAERECEVLLTSALTCRHRSSGVPDPLRLPDGRAVLQTYPEPSLPDRVVYRPTFHTTERDISAGTAFVARLPRSRRLLAIAALHTIGTAGGLSRDPRPEELPRVVKTLTLCEAFVGADSIRGTFVNLPLPGTASFPDRSQAGDVAAFWLPPGADSNSLALASETPVPGEPVWIAARVEGMPGSMRLHRAVLGAPGDDFWLQYRLDDPRYEGTATSGAPVLNSAGEVVGVHVAGGRGDDNTFYGTATPVSAFRRLLAQRAAAQASTAEMR
jgi:hypothetical protein